MSKRSKEKICYKCGAPATSKEHVPPACLFPEERDIKTRIFRNNLITVPSCDIHNAKKSKDDEFLMTVLAGIVGNNKIAYFHTITKVKRALERNGTDLLSAVFKNGQAKHLPQHRIIVGKTDNKRLESCFEHIACGLYFHKFNKIFEGECRMLFDFVQYQSDSLEKYKQVVKERIKHEKKVPPKEGSNPEIFRYQFFEPDEYGLIFMMMTFYEGASVFLTFIPQGTAMPFNMAGLFIESGIKTSVVFDGGVEIIFNENKPTTNLIT